MSLRSICHVVCEQLVIKLDVEQPTVTTLAKLILPKVLLIVSARDSDGILERDAAKKLEKREGLVVEVI